jgi:hypothetical protein
VCACCGATENLSIDHVDGSGNQHRAEIGITGGGGSDQLYRWLIVNGFPSGFQTLCRRCNRSKGTGAHCRLNHASAERSVA